LALETLVYHELRIYNEISGRHRPVFFYRTPAGVEVDFVIETSRRRQSQRPHVVAIEVKRSERWDRSLDKALRDLATTAGVEVDRMIGVYCGSRRYEFDEVTVLPVGEFVKELFAGEVF
jgi:predicted AAA+ superfamily ATPase